MKKLFTLFTMFMSLNSFALDTVRNFEWLEPNNKVVVAVGEPYQLKFSCSNNSLPFTADYADSWVHIDFSGGQHVVFQPTGYAIDDNGVITGLEAGSYALHPSGYVLAKNGVDDWLFITVVSEKSESESNNTLDTANEFAKKIRFGLYNISDIDYFSYTNNNLKFGDYVYFKIHYEGARETPFGYKWAAFCAGDMVSAGSLTKQDQECRALVTYDKTVYFEVYYDQSLSQYFNYGDEFVAEVYVKGTSPKCATPTIAYVDGKLKFNCKTEGVKFVSNITPPSAYGSNSEEPSLQTTYKVTVYATKDGYDNSDTATMDIDVSGTSDLRGDLNGDGVVNMPDAMFIVNHILNGKFPDEE